MSHQELVVNKVKPINVGLALAATVTVTYLLCALVVLLAPGAAEAIIALIAHSVNVDMMFQPEAFSFANVLGGTVVIAVYFFVTGTLFGWIYNRFDR